MDCQKVYFYTDTIFRFQHLLEDDNLKMEIVNSWKYLSVNNMVDIYAYVIMPNHIHLLWNILKENGKESPAGSFAKYTGHQFKHYLQVSKPEKLLAFSSNKKDRNVQFWKRDPLAIPIDSIDILEQKLEYIHNNPVRRKWKLSNYPEEYRWSSARFYHEGIDEFGILKHYKSA